MTQLFELILPATIRHIHNYSVFNVKELLKLMAFPFTGIDRKKLPDYAFLGLRRIAFGLSLIGQLDTLGRLS